MLTLTWAPTIEGAEDWSEDDILIVVCIGKIGRCNLNRETDLIMERAWKSVLYLVDHMRNQSSAPWVPNGHAAWNDVIRSSPVHKLAKAKLLFGALHRCAAGILLVVLLAVL